MTLHWVIVFVAWLELEGFLVLVEGGYYRIPWAHSWASKPAREAFCRKQARKFLPQRKPELILDHSFKK